MIETEKTPGNLYFIDEFHLNKSFMTYNHSAFPTMLVSKFTPFSLPSSYPATTLAKSIA